MAVLGAFPIEGERAHVAALSRLPFNAASNAGPPPRRLLRRLEAAHYPR